MKYWSIKILKRKTLGIESVVSGSCTGSAAPFYFTDVYLAKTELWFCFIGANMADSSQTGLYATTNLKVLPSVKNVDSVVVIEWIQKGNETYKLIFASGENILDQYICYGTKLVERKVSFLDFSFAGRELSFKYLNTWILSKLAVHDNFTLADNERERIENSLNSQLPTLWKRSKKW